MGDEDESLLRAPREFGNPCHNGSEEERHLHDSRPLQDQDPGEASNQSWSEDGFWPGDQGEGEASQDRCEGLPSRRTQVPDLSGSLAYLLATSIPETCFPWESHGPGLGAQLLCRRRMCQQAVYVHRQTATSKK